MGNNIPFQAQGKTYKANATTSSQTITITSDSPCNQLLVSNHQPTGTGGQPVYFVVSNLSNVTVSVPANGTSSYALVSVPASNKVYTIPFQFTPNTNMYIAFIGSAASECFFTPGEGF
jgi:hypothetical protein